VFVRQLAQRVRTADLKEFCEQAGAVRDAKLVYDKISGRSKGVAYVEFYEEASVQKAIGLTGQKLAGIPVIIELTETEKNRIAEEAAEAARLEKVMAAREGLGAKPAERSPTKVFVGGLHPSIGERELRRVLEPFGDLLSISIPKDNAGQSKGFAYVEFRAEGDAQTAVAQMNGFALVGKPIRVGIVKDESSKLPTESLSGAFSSLDDSETVGLSLNQRARAELMQKLSRDPALASRPAGPTPTILLTHMYDPEEETEAHWEAAIADEVREECSRYGRVLHLSVVKNKAGEVYVKFADAAGAQTAISALDGRWFGGRQIKATYVRPEDYHRLFPSA
jgi:RNA-binding protein 39